ncbi:hypothetical protein [Candidatus Thalassarchaeum betae]|uniref:Putative KH domain protein n=1 Tax=uncultured marine microorganism HF4000_APKG2H5 TaxID=455545 RepID=B3T6G6_9ZZZZ|nr:putative KH domain protein [uncultured marine microorganism HF4000_APKG2H5]MCH2268090.1 KH domain-containing protein [Candidatus Thalassoarchaea betae]
MSDNNDAGGPRSQGRASRLVAPGEDLGESEGHAAGHGVLVMDGRLRATKQGRVMTNENTVSIEPLRTAYTPRPSDLVIGFVEGCTNNIWFIDIGAPFNAILPMSLGPGKAAFGGTRSLMDIGEAVICRVQEVEETHSSVLTMKGMGLRKIRSGTIEEIDPHLLGRLKGKAGRSLRQLKEDTDCRIIVADNGRLWIDGEIDGIVNVRNRLQTMSDEAKSIGGVA